MDVTASFLAGALLSWALPIGLFTAVLIYWAVILRKRPRDGA
jgi:ABC-type sulfate transport system permease component